MLDCVQNLGLSTREQQILELAADGLTDKEIAASLNIALTTVRTYWDRLRSKLEVANRAQAVAVVYGRALSETRERMHAESFGTMFDRTDVAVALVEPSGQVSDANDRFLDLLGYSREEMQAGVIKRDLVTPIEYRQQDSEFLSELTRFGMTKPHDKEYIRKDGRRVSVRRSGVLLREEGHMVVHVLEIASEDNKPQNDTLLHPIRLL